MGRGRRIDGTSVNAGGPWRRARQAGNHSDLGVADSPHPPTDQYLGAGPSRRGCHLREFIFSTSPVIIRAKNIYIYIPVGTPNYQTAKYQLLRAKRDGQQIPAQPDLARPSPSEDCSGGDVAKAPSSPRAPALATSGASEARTGMYIDTCRHGVTSWCVYLQTGREVRKVP